MDDRAKSPTRAQIDDKLIQDELRLRELRENLDKSEQLTTNMVTILDSFTSRLKKLDDTILPVYNQTLRLTRLQENVDKTLVMMERVIGYYHVADEVEEKIREGPSTNIEAYLKLLDRLRSGLDYFKQFNPDSLELDHISDLFETGLEALEREFLQLLKKFSKPVHIATLHDVATCEDVEDLPSLSLLPQRVVSDLKVIADYLVSSPGENHADIMSVYAQIRSNQLGRALNALKESTQGQNLLPPSIPKKSSFAASFLKNTPNKRLTRRGTVATVTSSVGLLPHTESTTSSLMDETLEGCSPFLAAATVFLRLIQSEKRLMEEIIPVERQGQVLESLITQPLNFFMKEGETLFQQARKSVGHHDYSVVLSCLRLLKHVHFLLPEYRVVLQNLDSHPFDRFPHLLQQFDRLCSKALQDDYIQFIKEDSEKQSNLPKDGTVHLLTSNTLRFVDNLLVYSRMLGEVFIGQSSFAIHSTEDERKRTLGDYLVRVFDALNLNMENKARSYESPILAAVFLLNNFHFIHKTLNKSDYMLQLLEGGRLDVENHYVGLISQQIRSYQRGFTKLISFLGQEVSLVGASPESKLSNQKRQLLKDKFKGFNTELEDLHRIQQQWSIPDAVLRRRVRDDNVEMIVSLYTEFYRMYGTLNFTKNFEKYLKYTPESLQDTLQAFFDSGVS